MYLFSTSTLTNKSQRSFQQQYDTNVFGAVKVTRSILPELRRRRAGRAGIIFMMSSAAGSVGNPGASLYVNSKFALEGTEDFLRHMSRMALVQNRHLNRTGLSECIRLETADLNTRILVIQPGMFRTSSLTPRSHRNNNSGREDYAALNERVGVANSVQGTQRGDRKKLVVRVVDVLKGTGLAEDKPPFDSSREA